MNYGELNSVLRLSTLEYSISKIPFLMIHLSNMYLSIYNQNLEKNAMKKLEETWKNEWISYSTDDKYSSKF
jgi:hypothetical protein